MATKLKKMKLTSVDLVRAGANQEADICLYKSADPDERQKEQNLFKRFLAWVKDNREEEKPVEVEKNDDNTEDEETVFKTALAESLLSIVSDETLTAEERNQLVAKSLEEFDDAVAKRKHRPKLLWDEDDTENAYDDESVGLGIDEIEEIDSKKA